MGNQYIFINGRNGSGKDTQASILATRIPRTTIISPGQLYREAMAQAGEGAVFHGLLAPYVTSINAGGYFPDSVVLQMLQATVQRKSEEGIDTFIFTGFPRTPSQLDAVTSWDGKLIFLCYAVLEQHAINRTEMRRLQGSVRREDNPSVVLERLTQYRTLTEPVLRRLLDEGRLDVIKSNGDIAEVSQRTHKLLTEKYDFQYALDGEGYEIHHNLSRR